jgi:DNA-binding response OmpR family regulator
MAATRAEARHVEGWFDAAVVDLELPDGSGIDVASDLRTSGRMDQIIFFTACHDSGLLAKAAEMGRVVDKGAGVAMLLDGLELCLVRADERRVAVGDPTQDHAKTSPSQRSGTRRIR